MAKISTVYTIRNSRGDLVTAIPSGTRDSSTSLVLHGKGAPEYGLERNQNLAYLLEHFSNTTPPINPIDGQLWWKTGDQMYVFDESAGSPGGDWASVVPPPLALGFVVEAGAGLTGGGFPTLSPLQVVLDVGAGTGIQLGSPTDSVSTKDSEIVHSNLSGFDANDHIDHSTVTITAGRGLSGGGVLTANITFDLDIALVGGLFAFGSPPSLSIGGNVEGTGVPQGSPINVVRTSGDQRIAGIKTFTNQILADETNNPTTPAYRFTKDSDTGFYRAGANTLAFATGGVERFQVESDGVLSASTPSYTSLVTHDDDIPNKAYVDNQQAAGTTPTSNTFTGTSSISGLDGSHTYIVGVYGKVRYKGTGTTYLDGIDIRSGVSLGVGTILAQTPRQFINWPDGDIPIHNMFVVDMQGFTSLNCQLNSITGDAGGLGHNDYANQMTAVQLTNSIGTGSPGTGGGLSVSVSPTIIFSYSAGCPHTSSLSATASATGGTGPYTYAWSWDSGGGGITINDPTLQTTDFTHTGSGADNGVAVCVVTDTITPFASGSDTVAVGMECGT